MNALDTLMGITLNLYNALISVSILIILILSTQDHRRFFCFLLSPIAIFILEIIHILAYDYSRLFKLSYCEFHLSYKFFQAKDLFVLTKATHISVLILYPAIIKLSYEF